jgi:hypothetical protein
MNGCAQGNLLAGSHHSLAGAPLEMNASRRHARPVQRSRHEVEIGFLDNSTIAQPGDIQVANGANNCPTNDHFSSSSASLDAASNGAGTDAPLGCVGPEATAVKSGTLQPMDDVVHVIPTGVQHLVADLAVATVANELPHQVIEHYPF